jgi:type 2A phosphatase activator TIP41
MSLSAHPSLYVWSFSETTQGLEGMGLMCRAEKRLNLPLPEMTFGNNSLLCTYNDGSNEVTMRFNGIEALSEVGVGEGWEERVGGAVLVSMAESWGKNRYV